MGVKTVVCGGLQVENKMNKNVKRELLEALGHWGWIPMVTKGSRVYFLALGRMTYSHFSNRIFI